MKNLFNTIIKDFTTIKKAISSYKKADPWLIPLAVSHSITLSLKPFIMIYLSALTLNKLYAGSSLKTLLTYVIFGIIANFIVHILASYIKSKKDTRLDIMYYNQESLLDEKSLTMDYIHIENPEFQNLRRKLKEYFNIKGGPILNMVYTFERIVKSLSTIIISIIFSISLFKSNSTWTMDSIKGIIQSPFFTIAIFTVILLGCIISVTNVTKVNKKAFEYNEKFMYVNRILIYYISSYINTYNSGKDIRIFNQKELLLNEINEAKTFGYEFIKKTISLQSKCSIINRIISTLSGGIIYIFAGLKALTGAIGIGDVVKYAGAIQQFISAFSDIMMSLAELHTNNLYLEQYLEFLDIGKVNYEGTLPVEKRDDDLYEIEFKDVSFKYPSSNSYSLKHLSIKFRIGERLAIVGKNGSGKTTFIKLLCRLYDPSEGEILLNGINIKKYNYKEYLSLLSVVFQDFNVFAFPLAENIAASLDYNEAKVMDCIEKAGLSITMKKMNKGIQTPIYKFFDDNGIDISGGEAQKLALARAIYKGAPFVMLDEPTASLDPIAEYEVYSKFDELVGTKTAVYISHRLSSCRFCDDIAVFNNGSLVQRGSHETLVQDINGLYYELWNAQAQYYV